MFVLLGGAAFWLALSSVFGLIASIKFHSPKFLSDFAILSYGRAYPAWSNLLVYGFCIPAGLGVGLWLLARLGRVPLARPWLVAVAAKLWHFGVFVGLVGILRGNSTGFEWLEMPRYAAAILFVAFTLIGLCGFLTHRARSRQREEAESTGENVRLVTSAATLYPSQWFVLTALFWFPWIYSTAILLLEVFPVRGVVQASVAWWFSGNLLVVWLALAGLAASFYFMPKLSGRPLQSHYLALFAFWTLILFGSWVGIPTSAPLPAWMPALSNGAATLTLVPALAIAAIAIQTVRGAKTSCGGGPPCYIKFGVGSLVLSLVLLAASGVPQISRVTDFTWFGTAHTQLRLYGFFAVTMFGAAYYILPRVAGIELSGKLMRAQFWCVMPGTLLLTLPLAAGGVVQGVKLLHATIAFVDVAKSSLMFLRISTLGETLIAVGNFIFLFNVTALLVRYYRAACFKAWLTASMRLELAEVKP
jgi:cytochrome c oxidase cbb3-type subunit I